MLTESAKKLRDPLALGLLGATALYLLAVISVLLNSDLAGKFANRAAMTQGDFVNPVFVIITVAAVLLVAGFGEPSPMARTVVPAALGVQGVMLLFGIITLFASWGVDLPDNVPNAVLEIGGFAGITGAGKIVGTLAMLAYLAILGVGAFLTFTVFQGLPAPVKPQRQQQWGGQQWGQPQQQQWGGQPQQQQQWGGQPQQQQQWGGQQWGAAAGGAAAGGAAAGAWGQPTSGESSTGYAAGGEAGQPMPTSGESSSGYAAGGDTGQQAQQPQWGEPQPADPTQQWGQPQQGETPPQQSESQPQEGEDDRPGWWSPSS